MCGSGGVRVCVCRWVGVGGWVYVGCVYLAVHVCACVRE